MRRRWRGWQAFMDAARFVFLDETATTTDMARRYGRSPQGARLVAAVPAGHWTTTTCIAGLRESGVIAPLVLDNLAAHKVDGVHQAITRAGAFLLYLPPYSPDLSNGSGTRSSRSSSCSAKLKALLGKPAARTRDELWSTIGRLIEAVPPAECANYLAHSAYSDGSTSDESALIITGITFSPACQRPPR